MNTNWESLMDVQFNGKILTHAASGYGEDTKTLMSQFYVDKVEHSESPNHYRVTWDFKEFFQDENTFEWPFPHAITKVDNQERDLTKIYFSGPDFDPLNKVVSQGGTGLTIINRPVEFARSAGTLRYWAGAVDEDGNVYKVFWNIFNMFEPSRIEMTVDKSRYCSKCLRHWTSTDSKCIDDTGHEWISASED